MSKSSVFLGVGRRKLISGAVLSATAMVPSRAKADDQSSYQRPLQRGFFYNPYIEDSQLQRRLEEGGSYVGELLYARWPVAGPGGEVIANWAGGEVGKMAGWYTDNHSLISENLNMVMRELEGFLFSKSTGSGLGDEDGGGDF